ncbi:hypothetical protein UFOVP1254_91 [uncultured Caudovirales phage]|uniref:DUF5675 domain-containing protein n=1 Tax=uncultured Caudovirales phage TaxID=2100421 RepID=A0A6J5RLL7_9CAUD|nr:hypothetical protein UFOVP1254_91 [uncultured Caudovirales phage]
MIAKLTRGPSTDHGTFGVLRFGDASVFTTELPWRNNLQKRSCVPVGSYRCALTKSPRFGNVYLLANVPGRSHVLIHPANFAGDSALGWTTELEGCIAPCMRVGTMRNKAGVMQAAGIVSRPALNLLMAWANSEPFTLEITQ